MPSKKPRIALTVPAEVKEIYDFTASQMGVSTSKLVVSIMDENKESVLALGEAMKRAKTDPKGALADMQKMVIDTIQSARGQLDIEDPVVQGKKNKGS